MLERSILTLAFLLCVSAAPLANAQSFPNKPVQMVAPFAPGGALDLIARSLAKEMAQEWGHSVLVDNKAGAAGIIGTQHVARSAPDGYTIVLGATTTHGINPSLYKKLPYDAVEDFAPISLVATIPHVLVVNPAVPASTLREFIRHAKDTPNGLSFGSAGIGSPHHLAGELLKTSMQGSMVHIPYKGAGPAMAAVLSGEINFMSIEITAALPHIRTGKLKPIALASRQRLAGLDVPTFAESGMPGFELTSWYAVYAPKGTPANVVARLNAAVVKAIGTKEVNERLSSLGAAPIGSTPEQLAAHTKAEISRWALAVKASGASAE
jgi:tripartite-type tricarboxylate transporter receptor subunit TctC